MPDDTARPNATDATAAEDATAASDAGADAASAAEAKSAAAADAKPASVHAWIGGDAAIRALVDRFYDLMDLEPAYAGLRALHPTTLEGSRDKLYWFLCGWMGGPQYFVERFGHPMLRARHLPFAIGIRERDQWMACMVQAMDELKIDTDLARRLTEAFWGTADWMRNK